MVMGVFRRRLGLLCRGSPGLIRFRLGLIGHNGLVLPGLSLRQGYLVQPFAAFRQGLFNLALGF